MSQLELQEGSAESAGREILRDEWRCLQCDYSLRGTSEHRCPECGRAFDPDYMQRYFRGEEMPATPWEEKPSLSSFLTTAAALIRPGQFAARFPHRNRLKRAKWFSFFAYVMAMGVGCATWAIADRVGGAPGFHGWIWFALLLVPVSLAARLCEFTISILPRDRRRARGVVCYHSIFLTFSAIAVVGGVAPSGPDNAWPIAIVVIVWMGVSAEMLVAMDGWRVSTLAKCLLLPAIAVAAVGVGYLTAVVGFFVVAWFFSVMN